MFEGVLRNGRVVLLGVVGGWWSVILLSQMAEGSCFVSKLEFRGGEVLL